MESVIFGHRLLMKYLKKITAKSCVIARKEVFYENRHSILVIEIKTKIETCKRNYYIWKDRYRR